MSARRRRRGRNGRNGRARSRRGRSLWIGLLLAAFVFLLVPGVSFAVAGVVLYRDISRDLPSPEGLAQLPAGATRIFDRNGKLLYEIIDPKDARRSYVPLSDISPHVINATIATEDAEFYSHSGINLRGVFRAALVLVTGSGPIQGGSSITQQLVKNVLLDPQERYERTFLRKAREMLLALEVERRYTKDQILEAYLNTICYGNLSCGIGSAAESYFGVSAKELDLAQASMLVGIPQAPALYSPLANPEGAKERQAVVLDLMARRGFITREQAEAAKAQRLTYQNVRFDIQAPHFVQYVREALEKRYGKEALYRDGLRVTTTLDLDLQQQAERIVREHVERLRANRVNNAALVAIRPSTGEILAMVGSADFFDQSIDGQVNVALSPRQPGSSFKPITYLASFLKGYTPATMLLDVRTAFPDGNNPPYVPENVDRRFRGPVSVRQALAMSLNIPAVRALSYVGVPDAIALAHRLGITTLTRANTYGLSLTLGGGEVYLLDMAYVYSVFANGGTMIGEPVPPEERRPGMRELNPVSILRVEDNRGNVLYEFKGPEQRQVVDPRHIYLITDILSDNDARAPLFGPNSALVLPGRQAAVKTGSSDDYRDTWAIGYTPDLVTGVWVGNTDYTPMERVLSSTTAAPIWRDFMVAALKDTPPKRFPMPSGLVQVPICVPSGLLPTPTCPQTRTELFVAGTEPKTPDPLWQTVRIDRTTGLLASATTPRENIEERVFLLLPPEAADWARDNNIPQPPRDYVPASSGSTAITTPRAGAAVRGQVAVQGNANAEGFQRYVVEYGAGLNPSSWAPLGSPQTSPVQGGTLATWDTTRLPDGIYTLRLTTFSSRSGPQTVTVPVTIDNQPPSVRVTQPADRSSLRLQSDPSRNNVNLQAEVQDRGTIARVEFFVDGERVGVSTVYPYSSVWAATRGTHRIHAVAYDAAGNSSQSAPVTINVE